MQTRTLRQDIQPHKLEAESPAQHLTYKGLFALCCVNEVASLLRCPQTQSYCTLPLRTQRHRTRQCLQSPTICSRKPPSATCRPCQLNINQRRPSPIAVPVPARAWREIKFQGLVPKDSCWSHPFPCPSTRPKTCPLPLQRQTQLDILPMDVGAARQNALEVQHTGGELAQAGPHLFGRVVGVAHCVAPAPQGRGPAGALRQKPGRRRCNWRAGAGRGIVGRPNQPMLHPGTCLLGLVAGGCAILMSVSVRPTRCSHGAQAAALLLDCLAEALKIANL